MSRPPTAAEPAIELGALRKVFRHRRSWVRRGQTELVALDSLDLTVARGELFGLLGPNGAGKTTLVKICTTLLLPTSGTARVLGEDVVRASRSLRHRIGFVFGGERGLYWRLSGYDNLRYFADLYRIPPRLARRRIADLLQLVGLEGRGHDRVERYSRGMKQRLHLARGLLHQPELLFLDEPTIGLDPVGARDLRQMVRGLADQGTTIFLTTHAMLEAETICDRIAVMRQGRLVAEGAPATVRQMVPELGVVEAEVVAVGEAVLDRLRGVDGVDSVTVTAREVSQLLTIRCASPAELVARLGPILGDGQLRSVQVREPTLEDAYVRLVEG